MNAFGFGAARREETALEVEGLGKLIAPRRAGAYLIHTVEGEALEAVQFAPAGPVGAGEAASGDAASGDARAVFEVAAAEFRALGERQQALELASTARVRSVVHAPEGSFWLQDPPGQSLDAWLVESGAAPGPVIEAFARALARALAELHAHGLTHGDLNPRAVAIDGGEVRLILPMVDRRGFFRLLRSQAGLVEPGYAPPEAHDGARRQPIGPAADLYGASAILRRLVTGRAPDPATAIARLAGDASDGALAGSSLRAGIEAGMAMAPAQRPHDAEAWLAGLGLDAGASGAWFAGAERREPPLLDSLAFEPDLEAPPEPDFSILPPPVQARAEATPLGAMVDAPATKPERPRSGGGSTLLIAGAIAVAAAAGGAAIWMRPAVKPRAAVAPANVVPPPMAPVGCQWAASPAGGVGWRLRCADEAGEIVLPKRFDTQTATLASRGDVAAMERLGAFYRLRAGRTAPPNATTYADEAYAWLARAADSNPGGQADDERARDDAALALGEMFGKGEGGRAIDPAEAEARLRQAAAGSRADAVLALAQRLYAEAQQDPSANAAKLTEARRLFSRVARLQEDSPLRVTARAALDEIDTARAAEAAKAAAAAAAEREAERLAAARAAEEARAAEAAEAAKAASAARAKSQKPAAKAKPSVKPETVAAEAIAKARQVFGQARSKLEAAARAAAAKPAPPKPAPKPAARKVEPPRPAAPPVRNWTARTSVRIDDPTADFTFEVQEGGHAACEAEGGYAASVRASEVICPNGVPYCQVRVSAVCRGL